MLTAVASLADRIVAAVVPRASADGYTYFLRFCYCRGIDGYYRRCYSDGSGDPNWTLCGATCSIRYRGAC